MENILIAAKVIHKHKTEAEWKQEAYIPSAGEIIIYDPDANHANARYKTGTGNKAVTDLPFLSEEEFKSIQGQIDTVKVQMEETTSLAKAAQSGRVFKNYSDLIDYFNNLSNFEMKNNQLEDNNDKSWYNIGNNFFIKSLEVPDMWVSNIGEDWRDYVYTSDNEVVKALLSPNGLTVGYVTFSALENAKVNLEDYALKSELEDYVTQFNFDKSCQTLSQQIGNNSSDIDQLESLIEKHPDIGIRLKSGVIYANDEELATKKYVDENNTGGGTIKDINPIAGYGESSIILSPIKEEVEENKNEAFSKYSAALGLGAVAGSRGYHVLSAGAIEDSNQGLFVLEGNPQDPPAIEGYSQSLYALLIENSLYYTLRASTHAYNQGPIHNECQLGYWKDGTFTNSTEIPEGGVHAFQIIVDNYTHINLRGDEGDYLVIVDHPEFGTNDYNYAAHAEGMGTNAHGRASHAEGGNTNAVGMYSHTEGVNTKAWYASHAEGSGTEAMGEKAHAEGSYTKALGSFSHAEGEAWSNVATNAKGYAPGAHGRASHVEGVMCHASGVPKGSTDSLSDSDASHAEGIETSATHDGAHSEGARTLASGAASHAEGLSTTASGAYSHSEGHLTTASGLAAHAEGKSTKASGQHSHAEGGETKAVGKRSHTEGYLTSTGGDAENAHAEGQGTIARNSNQHVQGKYNRLYDGFSNVAHIVGNGTGEDVTDDDGKVITQKRSNAHTVDFNGNGWFAGDLYVGGEYAFYHNYNGVFVTKGDVKKVATEDYVNLAIQAAITSVLTTEV